MHIKFNFKLLLWVEYKDQGIPAVIYIIKHKTIVTIIIIFSTWISVEESALGNGILEEDNTDTVPWN